MGPGLGDVGPTEHFGHFPSAVKLVLSFCMIAGRLEIFTVLVIIAVWKGFAMISRFQQQQKAKVRDEARRPAKRQGKATVDLVESLGAETMVHVALTDPPPSASGGDDLSPSWRQVLARGGRGVVRLGPHSGLAAGDVVKLAVDAARVHLFDAETDPHREPPGRRNGDPAPSRRGAPSPRTGSARTASS